MIFIDKYETVDMPVPLDLLEQAARATLAHQSAPPDADLTLVLADDAQLHALNREYLGVDAPTDVLSFPADETDPDTGAPYLGDILISVPYAARQCAQAGNTLEAELQLLTVHGALHLLGHDHDTPEEKARMWQAQSEILDNLGLGNIQVREE